jgi:hypothetical protein
MQCWRKRCNGNRCLTSGRSGLASMRLPDRSKPKGERAPRRGMRSRSRHVNGLSDETIWGEYYLNGGVKHVLLVRASRR